VDCPSVLVYPKRIAASTGSIKGIGEGSFCQKNPGWGSLNPNGIGNGRLCLMVGGIARGREQVGWGTPFLRGDLEIHSRTEVKGAGDRLGPGKKLMRRIGRHIKAGFFVKKVAVKKKREQKRGKR